MTLGLAMTLLIGMILERKNKVDFVKMKSFCSVTDTVKRVRGQATCWEMICAKGTSGKGLLP